MYNDIINYILGVAMKHTAVKAVKYQSRLLINAQPTNPSLQFIVEDNADAQHYKQSGTFALNLNIDIIGHPTEEVPSLDMQSYAFQAANEIVAYVNSDKEYQGLLSTLDKDFIFLSHFTDDNSSGVRLSWQLAIPDPIDYCTLTDNFDEDRIGHLTTDDVDLNPTDIPASNENTLTLNPIRLPSNKKK